MLMCTIRVSHNRLSKTYITRQRMSDQKGTDTVKNSKDKWTRVQWTKKGN